MGGAYTSESAGKGVEMIDEQKLYRLLGSRVRALREAQSESRGLLTQAELAARVGMERTSITNIEKGTQKVPLHVFLRLCEALRASPTELLPSLPEVQSADEAEPGEVVSHAGKSITAPPLLHDAIVSVLNGLHTNAPTHR